MPRRKADVVEETEAATVMDEEFNEAVAEPEEQSLTDTEERIWTGNRRRFRESPGMNVRQRAENAPAAERGKKAE